MVKGLLTEKHEVVTLAHLPHSAAYGAVRNAKTIKNKMAAVMQHWSNHRKEDRSEDLHEQLLQRQCGVEDGLEHEIAMHLSEFKGSPAEWVEVEAMLRHRGIAEPPPETYQYIAQQETLGDVPRDSVRQAEALAGHGKAMVRDGFRMCKMILDTQRLEQSPGASMITHHLATSASAAAVAAA